MFNIGKRILKNILILISGYSPTQLDIKLNSRFIGVNQITI